MNVSEFDNVNDATEAMISSLQAFGYEASNSLDIVDKLNIVGNNFAISSDGIASGLQRSASTLVAAGNSLEQSIAMLAAGNKVIQDPEALGNALKVLSMRIRGTKTELEEAGEDTEGMVENTSKLREKVLALTKVDGGKGVDILDDTGAFRSTYDILVDIANVWDRINETDPKNQAALLELLAGKTRGSQLAAILQNPKDLKAAYEDAMNSSGSAMTENARYLDSIQGKIDLFTNSVQTFWKNLISSDLVKTVVSIGTIGMNWLDKWYGKVLAIVAVVDGLARLKKTSLFDISKDYIDQINSIKQAQSTLSTLNSVMPNGSPAGVTLDASSIQAYAAAVEGLTFKQQANALAATGMSRTQAELILQANGASAAEAREATAHMQNTQALNQENAAAATLLQKKAEMNAASLQEQANAMAAEAATLSETQNIEDLIKAKELSSKATDLENQAKQQQVIADLAAKAATGELTIEMLQQAVASGQITSAQAQQIISTTGLAAANKGLVATFKAMIAANPVGFFLTIAAVLGGAVYTAYSKNKQLQEEAINNANQEAQELQKTTSSLRDYASQVEELRGKLESGNLSEEEAYNVREQLISIQNELIDNYGAEAGAINLVTGSINDQIAAIRALNVEKANKWLDENSEGTGLLGLGDSVIDQAKKQVEERRQFLTAFKDFDTSPFEDAFGDAAQEEVEKFQQSYQKFVESLGGKIREDGFIQFDNATRDEVRNYIDQMNKYIRDYQKEAGHGLDLSGYIGFNSSQASKFIGDDYDKHKQNYQAYLENTAIASYTNEYEAILDAQDKYNKALADGDEEAARSAFEGIKSSIQAAADAAGDDTAMVNYFNSLMDAFKDAANNYDFEDAWNSDKVIKGWSKGLKSTITESLKSLNGMNIDEFLQLGGANALDGDQASTYAILSSAAEEYGWTVDQLIDKLAKLGIVQGHVSDQSDTSITGRQTYDELSESVSKYTKIASSASTIFEDHVALSDEMGSSLKSLIGDCEEWSDAMDTTNGYVVKNASLLRKLITQQRSSQKATIRMSKAQAQLQYQKTIQQIRQAISAMQNEVKTHGLVSNATQKTIDVLRSQLATLKETIQQYALLEVAMSDAANAYTEYENAKERDSRLSYDESFLEALKTIDNGILSGKVGTEEFEYAVKLIVPEDVYKAKQDLSDIDGMVKAIHDYCDGNPLLATWFKVDEESGDLSITTDNIRAFIKDSIKAGALVGTESDFHIADGIEGLEQYTAMLNKITDGAGVTEGAVLAMLSAMEDYDGTWGNILTDLQTSSIDRNINDATNALDDALKAQEEFIKNGEGDLGSDKWKELCANVEAANKALQEANNYAIKNVEMQNANENLKKAYVNGTKFETTEAQDQAQKYAETVLSKYNLDHDTTIDTTLHFNDDGSIQFTEEQLAALQVTWQWYLNHPASQMDIQMAVNRKQEDIELIDKLMSGESLLPEEKQQLELDLSVNTDSVTPEEWQKLKTNLQKDLDDYKTNWNIPPSTEDEDSTIEKLMDWESKGLTFKINVDTTGVKEDLKEAGLPVDDSSSSKEPKTIVKPNAPSTTTSNSVAGNKEVKITPTVDLGLNKQKATEQKEKIQKQLQAEFSKSPIDINAGGNIDPLANVNTEKVNMLSEAYNKAAAAEQLWGNMNIDAQINKKTSEIATLTERLRTLKENGASEDDIIQVTGQISTAIAQVDSLVREKEQLGVPTEVAIELVQNDIQSQMDSLKEKLSGYGIDVTANITDYTVTDPDTGEMSINVPATVNMDPTALSTLQEYVSLVNQNNQIEVYTQSGEDSVNSLKTTVEDAQKEIKNTPTMNVNSAPALSAISTVLSSIKSFLDKDGSSITLYANTVQTGTTPVRHANGTAHASGTAYAAGNWGLKHDEHGALVGEMGMEMVSDPKTGRYYTVGENGAEFVNLKKGSIIFNHKQTEALLKHGYVTSRGKMVNGNAFAAGTAHIEGPAHYGIVSYDPSKDPTSWKDGTAVKPWSSITDAASSLSDAASSLSSTADDVEDDTEQTIDFIEYKLENIENIITKTTSKLETFLDDTSQTSQKKEAYKELIEAAQNKADTYLKAIDVYEQKASEALAEIPEEFQSLAQNGGLTISDFIGEDEGEIASAIEKYREWAQKATDAEAGYYDAITEIASKCLEQLQDIADDYENVIGLKDRHSDSIQGEMDLLEESGERISEEFYKELIDTTNSKIKDLENERIALKQVLDDSVNSGDVKTGTDEWYEMVNAIFDVDDAITECKTDIEGFQNSINDLYWDNLDKLIDRIDNVDSELSHLYNLVSDDDKVVDEMGNWTSEGVTALGMLAQQLEVANYKVNQYGEAIEKLKKDYAAGLYSTDEYNEKLAELTENQWDAIEAQEDAKKSIVDLNKVRVEAVKDGIQKEIDSYAELIDKKKEELSLQKDAKDFADQVAEKQKEISDIEKKLAAMSGDTSASAIAQRKKLQEELFEAQKDLEDLYYDHSIEKQQDALDKTQEDYENQKQDEMDALDESLKNQDQVIADSYEVIKSNTQDVFNTLTEIAQQYGIDLSDAVINPWKDGINAIGNYKDQLTTASSSFTEQLDLIKKQMQDLQTEADKTAESILQMINQKEIVKTVTISNPPKVPTNPSTPQTPSAPSVGSSVTVKKTATNFSRDGGNGTRMQSWVPGTTFTVYQTTGSEVLIGRNGVYTGWVRLSDIEGYAKGSKNISEDQWAILDELGEEMQLVPDSSGRLSYVKKGTGIIPADLTSRLMEWGQLDPSSVLEQSKPTVSTPYITNNNMELNMSFGSLVHVDSVSQDTLPELQKMVRSEFNNCMKGLNQSLKRFTR